MNPEVVKSEKFTGGTRLGRFNVWIDTLRALGGIGDFIDRRRWVFVLCVMDSLAFGVAFLGPRREYPSVFIFIGPRFIGIDTFPEDG